MGWLDYVAASIVLVCSLVGVGLTLVSLPGLWFSIGVAIVVVIWRGRDLISVEVLIVAVLLGLLAELIELVASAVGAKKTGGTRPGAWGALIGAILGAIMGTVFLAFLPVLGTIIGGVVGAGTLAMIAEIGISRRTWKDSAKVGAGAAVGRVVALVVKGGLAAVIGILLSIAAFVP